MEMPLFLLLIIWRLTEGLPFIPDERLAMHKQGGSDMKSEIPGLGSVGFGDVTKTVSRFVPSGAGGDYLAQNAWDADDRPQLGYMDRETAGGRSTGSKSIFALPGIGRFEMADEREQGTGLLDFSKSMFPFLALPPIKEDYKGEQHSGGAVYEVDDVKRRYFGRQSFSSPSTTFAPFAPSILDESIVPVEERAPPPPPTPFDITDSGAPISAAVSPSKSISDNSDNPFDDLAIRESIRKMMKVPGRNLRRSPNSIDEEEPEPLATMGKDEKERRRSAASSRMNAVRAALGGVPVSSLGIKGKELLQLCARFAPIAEQYCYKSSIPPGYVDKCRGYAIDCVEYQQKARPLGAIANSFSSGVGLTYYSWGVNGIPYYPINEEGGVAGGSHGKVDFGSYGGGYSSNQGVRDFYSQTSEAGGNWYEGVYGSKTGWSVPIVQALGVEGGGGTQVHVPLKEGEFGRPIAASTGYHVGPYFGIADKVGVDWLNGGVSVNRGVAVPAVGVSVNTGVGVGFPSVGSILQAWDPNGILTESMSTSNFGSSSSTTRLGK